MNNGMKEMTYQSKSTQEVLYSGIYKDHKFAIVSQGTHPCAYIECKLKRTFDYDDSCFYGIDVHGGLTFCGGAYWDKEDKSIYLGWDYAHCNDFMGYELSYDNSLRTKGRMWTTAEIYQTVCSAIDELLKVEENDWKMQTKNFQQVKDKIWDIIKSENLIVNNQNTDYLIQKVFKEN